MKVTSLALDPIEKKPLARFHPGSKILSVGSMGCTMHCPWCQNHEIAQPFDSCAVPYREMSASELANHAEAFIERGNIGLAYTYNEPFFRWRNVFECAQAIHDRGMLNVVVTNGLISGEKLDLMLPYIDAFNIDLKGFEQPVYDICGGRIETVKNSIVHACEKSHVEVTTLIIPGLNDNMDLIAREAQWLASVNPSITLHLTRFFPQFKYRDRPATPIDTIYEAQKVAEEYLEDVVLGNV